MPGGSSGGRGIVLLFLAGMAVGVVTGVFFNCFSGFSEGHGGSAIYYIGLKRFNDTSTIIVVDRCCIGEGVNVSYGNVSGANVIVVNEPLPVVVSSLEEMLRINGKPVSVEYAMVASSYYHGVGSYDVVLRARTR